MDAPRPHRILRQHVDTDRLLGVDAVPRGEVRRAPTSLGNPTPGHASTGRRPEPATSRSEGYSGGGGASGGGAERIDVGDKLAVLQALDENEVRGCMRCELHVGRTQTVFGEGDANASLMIVGEGPGADEDRTGRPFVGRAGELLTKQIAAMGLSREQVYIANVVKCRPPNNRTPTPTEAETCGDYLQRQIEIIRPRVILTVGGPAAKLLLGTTTGITALRGQWHTYNAVNPAIPVMPTFHPAYLLRAYTKDNRAKVWSDLQQVMQRLG